MIQTPLRTALALALAEVLLFAQTQQTPQQPAPPPPVYKQNTQPMILPPGGAIPQGPYPAPQPHPRPSQTRPRPKRLPRPLSRKRRRRPLPHRRKLRPQPRPRRKLPAHNLPPRPRRNLRSLRQTTTSRPPSISPTPLCWKSSICWPGISRSTTSSIRVSRARSPSIPTARSRRWTFVLCSKPSSE